MQNLTQISNKNKRRTHCKCTYKYIHKNICMLMYMLYRIHTPTYTIFTTFIGTYILIVKNLLGNNSFMCVITLSCFCYRVYCKTKGLNYFALSAAHHASSFISLFFRCAALRWAVSRAPLFVYFKMLANYTSLGVIAGVRVVVVIIIVVAMLHSCCFSI